MFVFREGEISFDIMNASPSYAILRRGEAEPDSQAPPCRVAKLLEECPREQACPQAALPAALAPDRLEAPSTVRALAPPQA